MVLRPDKGDWAERGDDQAACGAGVLVYKLIADETIVRLLPQTGCWSAAEVLHAVRCQSYEPLPFCQLAWHYSAGGALALLCTRCPFSTYAVLSGGTHHSDAMT